MENNKDLLKKLSALGFSLLETEETPDANAALAEVVESGDLRLFEGFPVVLANSAEKGLFDYNSLRSCLKKTSDKAFLDSLLAMSFALYEVLDLAFTWADECYKNLPVNSKKEFNTLAQKLRKDEDFTVANRGMSSRRVKTVFNNYFLKSKARFNDLLSLKEELGLEHAMSQVFSTKQKELFLKKLKGDKLNKTEKEYFSRVVKKKVLALANTELHRMARELLY